jgi:hypothetical protein
MTDTERKRASLFGESTPSVKPLSTSINGLNLDRFLPKPAHEVDKKVVEAISEEAGFISKITKPAPMPTKKVDGRSLKKSPRTSQFNVRLKPETSERFWAGAKAEEREYADDFLAYLLTLYEGKAR